MPKGKGTYGSKIGRPPKGKKVGYGTMGKPKSKTKKRK
jgi:hypothetical protein